MSLSPGSRLGPYEVIGVIGAGGMGEVYRARDTRLGRDVALKILPDLFAHDADRLARFEREAKTLAALNHPNIAAIYGLEESAPADRSHAPVRALVMELVSGRTLDTMIADAAAPIAQTEALAIARSIAEALEAAHDAGIIHRDLKPANIKVRDDGVVKVLDFGLAKALAGGGSDAAGELATLTSPAVTQAGLILGTAAYMAPEQARGKPLDKRADVWAFGVVLFEMLTGRRLFDGETVPDVVSAVLARPIDLAALPPETPARVRELVARCLERDPRRRLRDIGEARIALESTGDRSVVASRPIDSSVVSGVPALPSALASTPARRAMLPWAIAALATLALAALIAQRLVADRSPAGGAARLQLEIGPPADGELLVASNAGSIIISPDGSTVAFIVQTSSGRKLYIRSLSTGETRALPGTGEVSYPFWSPDSRKIAFFGDAKLFSISVAGGLPEAITDIQQGRGGTWSDAGVILFTPIGGGTVHRVSERGGKVETVTTLDESRGENAHYWPVALPGGRKFLFFIRSSRPENNGIYLGSVDGSTKPVRVITSLSSGLYAPPRDGGPGHLLWVRDSDLLAQPFDIESGALTGEVTTVASDVRVEESQRGTFASVSANGTMVWASARASDHQLAVYERTGRRLDTLPIAPGKVMQPRISPDGKKLAFTRATGGTADVWQYDFASHATTQITTDPDYDESATWSPDGQAVFHNGRWQGSIGVLITTIDGSKPPVLISREPGVSAGGFTPDGRSVIVERATAKSSNDLAIIRIAQPATVVPLTSDPGIERGPALSRDGRWLAFVTDRSGRLEVVIAELLDDGTTYRLSDRWQQVSSAGGGDPHWRSDGHEVVYVAPSGTLMAVSVSVTGSAVTLGTPTPLFNLPYDVGGSNTNWDADGTDTKFVVVEAPHAKGQRFQVLTNWK